MNLNNENVMMVGAIPAYYTILPEIEKDVIDYIKNVEYEDFVSKTGYVSCNKKLLDDENLHGLKSKIEQSLKYYTTNLLGVKNNFKFKMTNSWSNKHKENNHIPEHSHTNCLISGILYLQTDDNTGDLLIKNLNSFSNLIVPEFEKTTIFNISYFRIKPKNNMIVFFPSHLTHMVEENKSNIDRYSLAFDFFPYGTVNSQFGEIKFFEPKI